MAVYWTLHCDITDADAFARVFPVGAGAVDQLVRRHGGTRVAMGRHLVALEGPSHAIDLLFRFDSDVGVEGFLNDPDFAEARALWTRSAANIHSVVIPTADSSANPQGDY